MFNHMVHKLSYLLQETGWIPQHIIARDEHENILGVVPLYLKRFASDILRFEHLYMFVISSPHFYFALQPFFWGICFRSFMGKCLLQLWCKVLSKVPILCTIHSSNWSEDFGSEHLIQRSSFWHFSLCNEGFSGQGIDLIQLFFLYYLLPLCHNVKAG